MEICIEKVIRYLPPIKDFLSFKISINSNRSLCIGIFILIVMINHLKNCLQLGHYYNTSDFFNKCHI